MFSLTKKFFIPSQFFVEHYFFNKIILLIISFFTCLLCASTELKVQEITFSGNNFFSEKELKKIIKSKEKKNYNPRLQRLDEVLLSNYYVRNGFLRVFISSEFKRKAEEININYDIKEGNRYYLNKLVIKGNSILSEQTLREWISHKEGKSLELQKIDKGLKQAENYYYNHGKPFIQIKEKVDFLGDSLVNYVIQINENQTVIIGEIKIEGLISVKSNIVKREIEIKVGEKYSRKKIEVSQRNLYGTGLFNFVNFNLIDLDTTRTHMQLLVSISEKKSKFVGLRFGIAYEQQIIYGGTFDWGVEAGHRNLFGSGRSAVINVIQSLSYDFDNKDVINPKNQYSFNYVEPKIFYTRTKGIFQFAFFQARPSNTVDYDLLTAALKIDHERSEIWSIIGELRYQDVITDSIELIRSQGQDEIYSIGIGLVGDRRDNFLKPSQGYFTEFTGKFVYSTSIDVETDASLLSRFFKITAQWNRYQPFKWKRKWTLATRVRGGAILGLDDFIFVPITERFFLGGASSVRGYREQLLGPVRFPEPDNPQALGGKYQFLVNLELRIPLFWRLYGEVFTDGGNVWIELGRILPEGVKFSSGAGLVFMTPLGAIRFDYGVKWNPTPRESPDQFHIGLSWAF